MATRRKTKPRSRSKAKPAPEPVEDMLSAGVPAPARTSVPRDSARTSALMIRDFYASIPTAHWERVLGSLPSASAGGKLLALMHDPGFEKWSLETKCAEAGIEFPDLVRLVSEHALGTAIMNSAPHLDDVVEGIAGDAKTRFVVCELCLDLRDGDDDYTSIFVAHPRPTFEGEQLKVECPKCGGVGRTRRMGDPRARETFLKLHGGLEETSAPAVQLNQQFNFGSQHAGGVHRGQQLLEQGRRAASPQPTVTVEKTDG
jgi:hypothetical protein